MLQESGISRTEQEQNHQTIVDIMTFLEKNTERVAEDEVLHKFDHARPQDAQPSGLSPIGLTAPGGATPGGYTSVGSVMSPPASPRFPQTEGSFENPRAPPPIPRSILSSGSLSPNRSGNGATSWARPTERGLASSYLRSSRCSHVRIPTKSSQWPAQQVRLEDKRSRFAARSSWHD